MNSNHSYRAFDREIDNVYSWAKGRVFGACGYSSGTLLDRLMQRIVEIGLVPYVAAIKNTCNDGNNSLPAPGTRINCGRFLMEIGSGEPTVTFRQFLSSQLEFCVHWAYCLVSIFMVKSRTTNLPAVLVFGVGEESLFVEKSDERFVGYCRNGPIAPLRYGKRFLIQSMSTTASSCQPAFSYFRHPLIALLREVRLGTLGRAQILANHLSLFCAYWFAAFRLPQLSLLGRDFAYSAITRGLDRRELIEAIVLTISSYASQPLWLRELSRATVHMVSYSQNWKPIIYSADRAESDVPNLRWIWADKHWVWTYSFADYLQSLCHAQSIEVVGPIVWYLPEIRSPREDLIEVVIFDVPALSDEVAVGCGELTNYYNPDNLFSFVRDIVSLRAKMESAFGLPVKLKFKTKRGYNAAYDKVYFDHLDQLNSSGVISLVEHSTNMYSLISSSHLAIVYPFSSPAYVAEALGVPSIYYDPTGTIVDHNFSDAPSLSSFANSPNDLLAAAVAILGKAFRNLSPSP
jgi:hypothetical protein